MAFYVHKSPSVLIPSQVLGIWDVNETDAKRIDVTDSSLGRERARSGMNAIEVLRSTHGGTTFDELELEPGEYYAGMARPNLGGSEWGNPDQSPEAARRRASATGQLHALIQQLEHICRVVQPEGNNFRTYGHEIRNVLLLACTEVEAQWKAILKAHSAKAENTKDYVKLCLPMRLTDYSVEFPYYPWMPALYPFENWRQGTKDLPWYAAYNSVKHDREKNFAEASLDNAFRALSGLFVMLCAQYGWDFALTGEAASRAFFRLKTSPQWSFSESYVPAYVGTLRTRQYKF